MSKSKFDCIIFIQIIAFEHFLSVILLLITKCLIPLIFSINSLMSDVSSSCIAIRFISN